MVTKFSCRFMSIIYKRRCIRLAVLMFFVSVSVGLVVKMHHVTFETNLERTILRVYNPRFSQGVTAEAQITDSKDEETLKARERFANIGVELVNVNKVYRLHSRFLNHTDDVLSFKKSHENIPRNSSQRKYTYKTRTSKKPSNNFKTYYPHTGKDNNFFPASSIPSPVTGKQEKEEQVLLVILVISKPSNVLLRQAARKTWTKNALYFNVLIRFIVGRLDGWDEIIDRESSMHSDMIVLEFQDTYETLPNKVLEGFKWALQLSSKPTFIMKSDDDTIINLPYLVSELLAPVLNSSQILGAIYLNSPVVRDEEDKWAVSLLDFPFSTYPPYAFGGGYVMSSKCAHDLLEARSKTVDWIHLEDVFITGILAMKSNITHKSHPGFALWTSPKATPCDFVQRKRITSVNHSQRDFFSIHEAVQNILRSGQVSNFCHMDHKNRTKFE